MTDLESALRTTLHERAGDVTELPARVLPEPDAELAVPTGVVDLAPHARHRRPLIPLLAAAAVAALIAGVGFVVAGSDDRPQPPVTRPALPPVSRASCATTLPTSWRPAVEAATAPVGDGSSVIAASRGGAVVEYDLESLDPNPPVRVGVVPRGGRTVTPIAEFLKPFPRKGPHEISSSALYADTDGTNVVLSWATGRRSETVKVIEAIDVTTGVKTVVTRRADYGPNRELSQGYVQDGVVYWQITKLVTGDHKDTIWSYDLATHRRVEIAKPGLYDLEKSAAGVAWNLTNGPVDRPAEMPSIVARQVTTDNADSFVSDGRSYAWVTRSGDLGWWGPHANRVVYIRGLLSKPWRLSTPGVPLAVAGPLVQYQVPRSGDDRIVDVRTGATVAAPGSLYGSDGELIGDPIPTPGKTGDVMRLPTAELSELRC